MGCIEVLTPKINWDPLSAKRFKTILILKIFTYLLFPKLFYLPLQPGPKTFEPISLKQNQHYDELEY